ncbi:ChbG/HpnK family deacetylase [Paucibacter sp. AS339]|uniref:ChbG/HpnK family deacetylase n=1 Tax=Paucibacter hankyongi TaxID=3133434 RepID=UPI0030A4A8D1
MKRVQICADDYGFDAGVSLGILECIDAGRISATSCMVLSPDWAQWAPALRERQGMADYGLHLDLNEFAPYAVGRDLKGWIMASYLRRLQPAQVQGWVDQQLDAFEAAMQAPPAYLDGHQHLHQLPSVRDAVLAALTRRYGRACALRSTRSRSWRGLKAAIIAGLGEAALRRGANRAKLRMNDDFAGVYAFGPETLLPEFVATCLASLPDAGLLMIHPGRDDRGPRPDAIRAARVRERAFWLSSEAGEMLAVHGVQLGMSEDWPQA